MRCHEPNAPAFPCAALADHHCPVRDEVLDVAVTVRSRARLQPAPHEDGVACALERHIPVVVAGSTLLHPYDEWATEVIEGDRDLLGACARAAAAPLGRHRERAERAVEEVLHTHDVRDVRGSAAVRRGDAKLFVTVRGASECAQQLKSMMSVRIVAALRELDPDARGIDVVFE
jgi:hypothetical protein